MKVFRLFVEKKEQYRQDATFLLNELRDFVGLAGLKEIRIIKRYDIAGIDETGLERAKNVVFSEPPVDNIYDTLPVWGTSRIGVELLPGQFDQRADSCAECVQLLLQGERPQVKYTTIYLFDGELTEGDLAKTRKYLINPVEARESNLDIAPNFNEDYGVPADIEVLTGFLSLKGDAILEFIKKYGLAMDFDDVEFCRKYFENEGREPLLSEIRVIDTYWSDHCRHTTFLTNIDNVEIEDTEVAAAYEKYVKIREELGRSSKPVTLMDIATIGAKYHKKMGLLPDLDESEEINACSVRVEADVCGENKPYLLMFKNETHNHPTEIEPFGGAATCIGGAIRDPLSGRAYVYQAMRVTGAADPRKLAADTPVGKLPQRKIVLDAARGYSSYGNQIGLATGFVGEIYHAGYAAKRLEIGAVVGAAPAENVRREKPSKGDIVLLIGGRTGRDGIGGATGSSKAHGATSLAECGAEVQKGNAPVERKLQRLFSSHDAARLIKRCNDFGAGGVCVAIGELADGLEIDLDAVPLKYAGLNGTEIAISESQERMAVVLSPTDVDEFLQYTEKENLEATKVATITDNARLTMKWRGKTIVDISRQFLNSNGAEKYSSVRVEKYIRYETTENDKSLHDLAEDVLSNIRFCSQKGLAERFDSTIGAGSVLMPFGGTFQSTPCQIMAAKLPVNGETHTCSGMAHGFDPYLTEQNPFAGARRAVFDSAAKLVAAGFSRKKMWLSFQEYFERLRNNPKRWGKPFAALLGALDAQLELGISAIGGKDSMSGSYEELDVPPTLVSFAVAVGNAERVLSPEFKYVGTRLAYFPCNNVSDVDCMEEIIKSGKIYSVWVVGVGGLIEGLCKMAFGNRIGAKLAHDCPLSKYNSGFLVEMDKDYNAGLTVGETIENFVLEKNDEKVDLLSIEACYEKTLESVFSTKASVDWDDYKIPQNKTRVAFPSIKKAIPTAFIPVFPGNNCELDTARALIRAGAKVEEFVIRNLRGSQIVESSDIASNFIDKSEMIVIPGGFSGGDEPDGSAKFIAAFFRNKKVSDSVNRFLARGGLILGICNGFQALVKLGLLPYGEIRDIDINSPTLTFNSIGRHQSLLARTKITSTLSPWLSRCAVGDVYVMPMSHGEGRFVANLDILAELGERGQISSQYVDNCGMLSKNAPDNPNGSMWGIEAISSADGRILGKMGHSERAGNFLYKNVPGNKFQPIFESGVDYFK